MATRADRPYHKYPVCSESGKKRYRTRRDAKNVVIEAKFHMRRAARWELTSHRRECRAYACSACGGWHTTSRPYPPQQFFPQ